MRAAVARRFGGPEVVAVEDVPKPVPAAGRGARAPARLDREHRRPPDPREGPAVGARVPRGGRARRLPAAHARARHGGRRRDRGGGLRGDVVLARRSRDRAARQRAWGAMPSTSRSRADRSHRAHSRRDDVRGCRRARLRRLHGAVVPRPGRAAVPASRCSSTGRPARSAPPWCSSPRTRVRASPACAAPATPTSSAPSAPRASSTTRARTSPRATTGTTSSSNASATRRSAGFAAS